VVAKHGVEQRSYARVRVRRQIVEPARQPTEQSGFKNARHGV
jgi:hypothetical protein